jgi:hypothetical protein
VSALIAFVLDVTPLTPSELRWELASVAIGFILLSIGLAAIAVFFFRRGSDLALLELRRWSGAEAQRTHDDDITLLVLDFPPSP